MNEDILSVIEYKMPALSKGQKRIAAWILQSCDQAAFMTASTLGKQAGVSEATVVRFATELGYDGYPQMQKALQDTVLSRLTSSQRMDMGNSRLDGQDVISSVLYKDAENIRQTAHCVDRGAFQSAIKDILNARRIYVIGARNAAILALFFGEYLRYMFREVHTITQGSTAEVLEQLVNLKPEDVVIAFSFPRYAYSTVEASSYCHGMGAKVIGITNSSLSPLSEYCDWILTAQSDMLSVADSLTAPLSLVNALIVSLSSNKGDVLKQNFERLETIWQSHHVYEKRDRLI